MCDRESQQIAFAEQHRLTLDDYKKLASSLTYDELVSCLELLRPMSHRSEFRAKMASAIRSWLSGGAITAKPLSPKQFEAIKPRWPVHYNLP